MNSTLNFTRLLIVPALVFGLVACNASKKKETPPQKTAPQQEKQVDKNAAGAGVAAGTNEEGSTQPINAYGIEDRCLVRRAAFDVGSGSTKMKVADVDVCAQKILAIVLEEDRKVDFAMELQNSADDMFNQDIMEKGFAALEELKAKAQSLTPQPTQFSGVATAAFRKAKNGEIYAAALSESLGIALQVITQDKEAMIGFVGAANAVGESFDKLENVVVWDIGGQSMQISTLQLNESGNLELVTWGNQNGSVPVRNLLITEVKGMELIADDKNQSPNPLITVEELNRSSRETGLFRSIELVRNLAIDTFMQVSDDLLDKLEQPETRVIGIGGVHYHSVRNQVDANRDKVVTYDEIKAMLETQAKKNDEQIGGNYASTEVSNLVLVSTYMRVLGINQVECAKVNLANGILVMSDFWPKSE